MGKTTKRERLLVIGGDAAGMSAASQARRRRGAGRPGDPRVRARAPRVVLGVRHPVLRRRRGRRPRKARRPHARRVPRRVDIDLRLRNEVVEIDLDRRRGPRPRPGRRRRALRERFDHLVFATGAVPVRPRLPGADAEGVYGVQILDDGIATLRAVLDARAAPRRAVVVGGGYIGLEMAEALVQRGLEVSLVDAAEQPMRDPRPGHGRARRATPCAASGSTLYLGEPVEGFETVPGRAGRRRPHREPHPARRPGRPRPRRAARHRPRRGRRARGRADRRDRHRPADARPAPSGCGRPGTAWRPSTWCRGAAGRDRRSARTPTSRAGSPGINLGGGYATFPGVVGTAVTKICDVEVARTGLRRAGGRRGRASSR